MAHPLFVETLWRQIMNSIPNQVGDWSNLNEIISAASRQKILTAALRLKVFDHVAGTTAVEVAARAGSHPRNTELLLNALAAMDIIRKQDGRYEHTKQSEELLVTTATAYLGDYLQHVVGFHEQFPVKLEDLVRHGPPTTMPNMTDESMWAHSARQSAAYQYSGEAQHIAHIVGKLPEFRAMTRMLDLGGGAGFFTMAIVSAHPSMTGVVFEQPAVAEVAREFIRDYGMEDRVSVVAGDYARDALQGPYDLIFASSTLNFYKHRFDDLFLKIRDALGPRGVFMTHQDGLRNEHTKPANLIAEFLIPQMLGADFGIAEGEIAEAMLRVGFQSVRSFTKNSSVGEMAVDIGRTARERS
jgi:predicted O-methyltransferase YrrM